MFKCCSVTLYIPLTFFLIIVLFLGLIFQPPWTTYALKRIFPLAIIHFDRECKRKYVVLTVDDGPNDHLLYIMRELNETNSTTTSEFAYGFNSFSKFAGVYPEGEGPDYNKSLTLKQYADAKQRFINKYQRR